MISRCIWLLIAITAGVVELDYGFTIAALLFALWTPSKSPYRAINIILACEFAITLGITEWTIHREVVDTSVWIYATKMMKDCIFATIFLYFQGRRLAILSWLMGIFHLTFVISLLNGGGEAGIAYVSIMTMFCIAQLVCGLIGLIHGTANCGVLPRITGNLDSNRSSK